MALDAFLSLTGATTGKIKGSVIQRGREGKILVIAASHQVSSSRTTPAGSAAASRVHTPFIITKELDQSTPLLYKLMVTDELITQWELNCWGPNKLGTAGGTGAETQTYTVRLTNARIIDIRFTLPNIKDPDLVGFKEYEEVSFVYEKIEWVWLMGNKMSEDNW